MTIGYVFVLANCGGD